MAANPSYPNVVIDLAKMTSLDPDTIDKAISEVAETEGQESVDEALEELATIPTGEGLTKKEAKRALIDEMNKLIQRKNVIALRTYNRKRDAWWEKKRKGEKAGVEPRSPFVINTFAARHIDQVVCMARRRGGYEKLLEAAGYAPLRKR
jgi:hypothetical protein